MEERACKSSNSVDCSLKNEKIDGDFILTREFDFNAESTPQEKILEIFRQYSFDGERDLYGNLKCDFLQIKPDKSKSCINILKFFRPGEILESMWIKD
jgi:hypothetical protein